MYITVLSTMEIYILDATLVLLPFKTFLIVTSWEYDYVVVFKHSF